MNDTFREIRRLVGDVSPEQLRFVDSFVCRDFGIFIPSTGPCLYALQPEHTHPAYMFTVTAGDPTAIRVGERTLRYGPNMLSAFSPAVPHQDLQTGEFSRYIAIVIHPSLFDRELRRYRSGRPPRWTGEAFQPPAELKFYLRDFMNEAETPAPGREALLSALALRITHLVIRALCGVAAPKELPGSRLDLYAVIEYLQAHFGEDIDVEGMAAVAAMSPSHFSRTFRRETGASPMEYLHRLRMEKAKKLLIAGDLPVTEIALSCGFGSSAYFSSCFQKHFKTTPTQLRASFR